MIPRYTRPEMADIWSEENRFKKMLEVEILACEAMARMGRVPKGVPAKIRKRAKINIARINEIEKVVKHDVIAFLTQVGETVGRDARHLHLGMTSSDVLDTALSVQMVEALGLLIKDAKGLLQIMRGLALKYKDTPMMGRTHGVHAQPLTFGLKAAGWFTETQRIIDILEKTVINSAFGKISGAVGTFANLDPRVEEYVCKKLGLKPEPVSTQIIPRDRHSVYLCRLAICAGSLERMALEVRHLQRTEVMEAEEPFTKGQKGSSAMPHKRNPILSENVCGLARLMRGFALTGLENIALWHERDISHSSAERVALPDSSITLDFMFARISRIFGGLEVYPENMLSNLERSKDTVFSGTFLVALVNKGISREEAYKIMQDLAFEAREKRVSMEECVLTDRKVRALLTSSEIKECFSMKPHLKYIPYIFRRAKISK